MSTKNIQISSLLFDLKKKSQKIFENLNKNIFTEFSQALIRLRAPTVLARLKNQDALRYHLLNFSSSFPGSQLIWPWPSSRFSWYTSSLPSFSICSSWTPSFQRWDGHRSDQKVLIQSPKGLLWAESVLKVQLKVTLEIKQVSREGLKSIEATVWAYQSIGDTPIPCPWPSNLLLASCFHVKCWTCTPSLTSDELLLIWELTIFLPENRKNILWHCRQS